LDLDDYKIVIYSEDLSREIWSKEVGNVNEYILSQDDRNDLVDAIGNEMGDLVAVVFGRNDGSKAANGAIDTGYYASNAVRLALQNYNRYVVLVVDSSGSNLTTDPDNLRIVAAKTTVKRLTSFSEAQTQGILPDLSAGIDFDASVTILSDFADPDLVEPVFNAIDSEGNTAIDRGINAAVNLLDSLQVGGFSAFFKDRAAIFVFTDGQNNDGPIPVIQAIAGATLKGIRVHYGFLQPGSVTKFVTATKDQAPLSAHEIAEIASIEEAVLASGGTYGVIGNAETQIAFVDQVFNKGLTNRDSPKDTGGVDVVGQVQIPDKIDEEYEIRSHRFRGKSGENVRILVDSYGFDPVVWVVSGETGNILDVDYDDNMDRKVDLGITLPASGYFYAKIHARGNQIGEYKLFVDVSNIIKEPYYVLNKTGPLLQVGNGIPMATAERTIALAVTTTGNGFLVLSPEGEICSLGDAYPLLIGQHLNLSIARDIELTSSGQGSYVLDGFGAVHTYGDAVQYGGLYFGTANRPLDLAEDLEVTPSANGYYILDAMGGVHPFGDAVWQGNMDFGFDLARDIEIAPDGEGYLILDGFGIVHGFGSMNEIAQDLQSGNPFFGIDIARDLEITETGQGWHILDGHGTIYAVGDAEPLVNPATSELDIFVDLERAPSGFQNSALPNGNKTSQVDMTTDTLILDRSSKDEGTMKVSVESHTDAKQSASSMLNESKIDSSEGLEALQSESDATILTRQIVRLENLKLSEQLAAYAVHPPIVLQSPVAIGTTSTFNRTLMSDESGAFEAQVSVCPAAIEATTRSSGEIVQCLRLELEVIPIEQMAQKTTLWWNSKTGVIRQVFPELP